MSRARVSAVVRQRGRNRAIGRTGTIAVGWENRRVVVSEDREGTARNNEGREPGPTRNRWVDGLLMELEMEMLKKIATMQVMPCHSNMLQYPVTQSILYAVILYPVELMLRWKWVRWPCWIGLDKHLRGRCQTRDCHAVRHSTDVLECGGCGRDGVGWVDGCFVLFCVVLCCVVLCCVLSGPWE